MVVNLTSEPRRWPEVPPLGLAWALSNGSTSPVTPSHRVGPGPCSGVVTS